MSIRTHLSMGDFVEEFQLEGVSCRSVDIQESRTQWSFEAYKLIQQTQAQLENIKSMQKNPKNLKLSRQRLKSIMTQVELQLETYLKVLKPFGWENVSHNQFLSYLQNSPGKSFFSENIDYLFRDWCWGEKENQEALKRVKEVLQTDQSENFIVLGSGACRLGADLAETIQPKQSHFVDYNPLLLMLARQLITGKKMQWVEFPMVPKTAHDFAINQQLKSPVFSFANPQFHAVDLREGNVLQGSYDLILTPWLIDVVDMDLKSLLGLINKLMPIGGEWINWGPLGFNNPILSHYYSLEEVNHLISRAGFEIKKSSYEFVPYLQSPHSNSHRLERVYCFSATKVSDCEEVEFQGHRELPWQQDPNSPIEIPVDVLNLERGHQLNAHIFRELEKKPSFNELFKTMLDHYKLPADQIAYMLNNVLYDIHFRSLQDPHH